MAQFAWQMRGKVPGLFVMAGKAKRFAESLPEFFPAYQVAWIKSQTFGGASALEIVRRAVAEAMRRAVAEAIEIERLRHEQREQERRAE